VLWNADERYRPEMKQMERNLVLMQLDTSWKNHLYTMDHLRSGIGLVGYAQEDPKSVYKQEGMKEFRAMWECGGQDHRDGLPHGREEAFEETIWARAVHDSRPRG
jgi:preprotein translocase subunit SecA